MSLPTRVALIASAVAAIQRSFSSSENPRCCWASFRLAYWDVIEAKPEPGYGLFVRFEDGLAGVRNWSAKS